MKGDQPTNESAEQKSDVFDSELLATAEKPVAEASAADSPQNFADADDGPFRLGQSNGPNKESGSAPNKSSSGSAARKSLNDRRAESTEEIADEDELQDGFTHEGQVDEYEQDDPLAPAFDLEQGVPLNEANASEVLPHRATVRSPKEFFNTEILYRYDILEDGDRTALKGTYRIELRGFQGGVWSIELGDTLNVVNRREEAEIVMTMQQKDFLHLVNGQLNPQLAIFAQKLRISGDIHKGVLFQSLLIPQHD